MHEDARRDATRYRLEREARERGEAIEERPAEEPGRLPPSREERAAFVETSIQQAIRAGEFDDLPGAGKPLTGLGGRVDPDWWIRRKIEREKLDGLGPPALTLRTEDARLDERLDRMHRETDVREALEDFNARVIEARRQLLGGPPVVTRLRDADAEVLAWRRRRAQRARDAAEAAASEPSPPGWWERRRDRRRARRPPSLES